MWCNSVLLSESVLYNFQPNFCQDCTSAAETGTFNIHDRRADLQFIPFYMLKVWHIFIYLDSGLLTDDAPSILAGYFNWLELCTVGHNHVS